MERHFGKSLRAFITENNIKPSTLQKQARMQDARLRQLMRSPNPTLSTICLIEESLTAILREQAGDNLLLVDFICRECKFEISTQTF